jgi:chromosome partitioning protein
MTSVLAVLNRKGGVGKTTLAIHLGHACRLNGSRVLLVDADPQGSMRDWHAAGNGSGMDVIAADTPTALASIPTIKAAYDLVVIDGTAGIPMNAAAAVRVADNVLIPVQPSGLDLWATNEIVGIVKSRREIADGKPEAWFVLSRVIARSRAAREASKLLPDFGLPVLDSQITQRVVYPGATSEGTTVLDVEPTGVAAHEIRALYREIVERTSK